MNLKSSQQFLLKFKFFLCKKHSFEALHIWLYSVFPCLILTYASACIKSPVYGFDGIRELQCQCKLAVDRKILYLFNNKIRAIIITRNHKLVDHEKGSSLFRVL